MSQITTHILDTSVGKPASGVSATLEYRDDSSWTEIASGVTDVDGRIGNLLKDNQTVDPGVYRLIFNTGDYYEGQAKKCFYPKVVIVFETVDTSHYHVPLLLNPFGYSTYRGS
ncbi:MAG: hydroxyisourate hydrolase [Flavobacteriales bacterium]|nr:hydroxyisourate hydrolase [Flavobacteriales bacterium]MBL4734691.1 hydroxyisourate hydrolase [Flavobacteriales bacterium]PCH89068.1 MAG: hydroxyisourate hydrolase [Flavobacteriales bacterium]